MNSLRDILQELVERRYSQKEIANAAGVTQPTISRLLAGSSCDYDVGKKIEAFHQEQKANDWRRANDETRTESQATA